MIHKYVLENLGSLNIYFYLSVGEIGDWKNWFTVAQSEKFNEVFKEKTKTSETKMLFSQYL